MLSDREISRLNSILENKTFKYTKGLFSDDFTNSDFDFKFKILGYKKMISVGEYYDYFVVSVKLLNFRDELSKLIFLRRGLKGEFLNEYFKKNMYFFKYSLSEEIQSILKMFDNDVRITFENIETESDEKQNLQEQKMTRLPIRTVVKDILNTLKKNEEGEFYLPENDIGLGYSFENFPIDFSLELTIKKDDNINQFMINANFSEEDDVIEILIIYNPKKLRQQLYDIVGELNEILTHEIQHGLQKYRNQFRGRKTKSLSALKYYLQPHELDAQIAGFKRLSKLRKLPFEEVVRNWFDTHEDIHTLNDKDKEKVIRKILEMKK